MQDKLSLGIEGELFCKASMGHEYVESLVWPLRSEINNDVVDQASGDLHEGPSFFLSVAGSQLRSLLLAERSSLVKNLRFQRLE